MDWFEIAWEGPFLIPTHRYRNERVPEAGGDGVYAIYGIEGKKSMKLLYIGETYRQTFGERLRQHEREWLPKVNAEELVVCFGSVRSGKSRVTEEMIKDVEQMLIHEHIPPYNRSSKRGYAGRSILIFNVGKIGLLDDIMTSDRELEDVLKNYFAKWKARWKQVQD